VQVSQITEYTAFLALEKAWNDAVERAGTAHPFLRHEWMRTWWEAFGGGDCQLRVLVVRSGDRITAIAPLMRETGRMYGVPVRRLRFLQNDHTPRADVIVAERPEQSYRAIWQALVDDRDNWDVLQLSQLPGESTTRETFSKLAADGGYATGVWRSGDSPYVTLNGSWDAYFSGRSAKFRQNVRNRISRLRQFGEPQLEVVSDGAAIQRASEDAVRLEESGWKNDAGTAIGADEATRAFYTSLVERAMARGWLRLLFLTVNGRRIAGSFGLCYQRRLFLCKTGYDPTYAKCSPFKVLTYLLLREAFAEGLAEVDLLGDPEPWKLEWTTTTRQHDWLFVFSGTARARLLYPVKFRLLPALKRFRAGRPSVSN
jgi:CelD/BcsL family acetyltransferase involved in cellulose biosynthesis